jgi:hypothetical protein
MSTRKNQNKINKTNKARTFKNNDYNSNDGMLTSIWGPPLWHVLHSMSFNYPINPSRSDKIHYRDFILNLRWTLPCGKCRENLVCNFKKLPIKSSHMKSRDTFSKYVYDLHEVINKMLGKKASGLSYTDVRERYEHFRSRCTETEEEIIKRMKHNESGCVKPLYGAKSKCVLKIIPDETKCESFEIDKKCIKQSIPTE